ncbi:unnamed protein product [Symbiodinium sp. CCMP2592]|nr:unnamed protein product [Symbiodinium sp. CCMP2592]
MEPASEPDRPQWQAALVPLTVGTEVEVIDGHRRHLVGRRGIVLPTLECDRNTTRNVRIIQGPRDEQRRIFTIDKEHLAPRLGLEATQASMCDGMEPSLRWRCAPPPLTIYSARYLLGYQALETMVPPAAPKRNPAGHYIHPPVDDATLEAPWEKHVDQASDRPYYYHPGTKQVTWRKPRPALVLPREEETGPTKPRRGKTAIPQPRTPSPPPPKRMRKHPTSDAQQNTTSSTTQSSASATATGTPTTERKPAPAFDPQSSGGPSEWNLADHALPASPDRVLIWGTKARTQLPQPPSAPACTLDVERFLQSFFRTRQGPTGTPLATLLGDPVPQPDGWWRLPWTPLDPSHCELLCQDGWLRGWHGCKMEALYSIIYHGQLLPSTDESKGDRFLAGCPGVYLHRDSLQHKVENYMRWIPLCGDGLFWAAKWEVVYAPSGSNKHGKRTDQVIQSAESVELVALWLSVRSENMLPEGTAVQATWTPAREANPCLTESKRRSSALIQAVDFAALSASSRPLPSSSSRSDPAIDDKGRLKPTPKAHGRLPHIPSELEKDCTPAQAKLTIQAGDLVLRSATAHSSETPNAPTKVSAATLADPSDPPQRGPKRVRSDASSPKPRRMQTRPKPRRSIWFDVTDNPADQPLTTSSTAAKGRGTGMTKAARHQERVRKKMAKKMEEIFQANRGWPDAFLTDRPEHCLVSVFAIGRRPVDRADITSRYVPVQFVQDIPGTWLAYRLAARPLRLGLAAWRLGGYHLPLKASIPLQRQHRLALWQTPPMQDGIRSMWQAYRVWKTAKAQAQHNPLYVSRCYHHFKTAHKAFRRAGKEAKKHWFHGRLQELQTAASSGDSRKLYAGIRTLAPKSSKPKVQLRDSGGHLQDPKTQLKQLETHYRKLYAADEDGSIQGPQRQPIHIEVTEAEMTLADLGPCCASLVPMVPAMASNTRALEKRMVAKLRPYAERFLADQAQFAYLPGAQLSLDLSSAFDLMDWRLLDKALLASEVPAELRHQIMSWHSEISYVLTHLGHTAKVEAQRGLRQGCKLAPLLWTLALAQIYREILAEGDPLLTAPWLEQCSTIYADDIHLKDTVQNTRELDDMVHRFSKILDALAAHGMVINSAKSALLLRHKGSFIRGWLRRHLIPKPEGDLLRFRSPRGTVYEIPLRDHHTYLGIRISYHSQAKQAVTYRLQAANQAWQRLRGVLCSTRHLAQTHRLSLWKSTVLPTLLYGIAASNPGAKDIQRMQHMMTKQVRAITRSFAHLQKESTQDLLHRCSLSTILEWNQLETLPLHFTSKCNANGRSLLGTQKASQILLYISARNVIGSLPPFGMHMEQKDFQRADTVPIPFDNGISLRGPTSCQTIRIAPLRRATRWTDLLVKPETYSYLQHHCPLCYQWLCTMTLCADPMELDEQEKQFWAHAGPVKRDRNKGKGKGTKGKGKGKQGLPSPSSANQDLQPLGNHDPDWMEYRMNRLSQLVLRQEQIISAIRQDLVLYLFVRSGPEGMVPVLCEAAEKWRKMKEEEPEKITYSLKLMLFKQLLITLHQRLTNMIADEDALAKAKNLNWIDDQKHWKHLTWNPTKQCLEVDNSVRPIPAEDLLAQLVQMRKAVTEETLVRFKSMRKLTTEVTSDWIQFQICMSLRPEGGAMWSTLNQWIGQASWHTLGCRLRRDRPNYDTLVQEVWQHQYSTRYRGLCCCKLGLLCIVSTMQLNCYNTFYPGIATLDKGPTQAPIPIALPVGPSLELQAAIDGWSAQVTARYALLNPSPMLCIQLQRFTNAEGVMRRDTRPLVVASTTVRMPLFTGLHTMQVRYVHYQVVAVQLHYGGAKEEKQHISQHKQDKKRKRGAGASGGGSSKAKAPRLLTEGTADHEATDDVIEEDAASIASDGSNPESEDDAPVPPWIVKQIEEAEDAVPKAKARLAGQKKGRSQQLTFARRVRDQSRPETMTSQAASSADHVEVVAPAPVEATSDTAAAGTGRRNLGTALVWQPVLCPHCRKEAGRWKLNHSPGQRDPATYHMTTRLCDGSYASAGETYKTRRQHLTSEEKVRQWILLNKVFCKCPVAASSRS